MDALFRFYVHQVSCRKREVIYWVSQGFTNDEVAERLSIESCGVAEHLTEIYALLVD